MFHENSDVFFKYLKKIIKINKLCAVNLSYARWVKLLSLSITQNQ